MLSLTGIEPEWLEAIRQSPLVAYADEALPTEAECRQIMELVSGGSRQAADVVGSFPTSRQGIVFRGLVWLAKFGLITVTPA